MRMVAFRNGGYGIRKGIFRYSYLSIYDGKNSQVKWQQGYPVHHFYCGNYEDVLKVFNWITDCGKVC